VGIAISEIGAARPGWAAALGPKLGGLNDIHDISQKSEAIQSAYSAYLTRIRQPDEARWGGQVLKTGRVIRETGRLAEDWSPLSGQPLRNLMAWWVLDLSLLSSGLCLVFLAGIAGLRWKNREGRVPLLTVVGSLMVIVSFSAIVPWTGAFADLLQMISGWCTCLTPERVGPSSALSLLFFGFPGARVVCVLGTAGLAMILIAVSVLPAVLKGRPLAPAILQGVRTRFVPLGCVLLLLYGGCLITTLSVENSYNQKLNQVIQHEGQCLLRTQGLPWPAAER